MAAVRQSASGIPLADASGARWLSHPADTPAPASLDRDRFGRPWPLAGERQRRGSTPFADGLGSDLDELGELSLLGYYQDPEFVAKPSRTYSGGERFGDFEGHLAVATLMPTGRHLYELMELHCIPEHEKDHIFNLMQPRPE